MKKLYIGKIFSCLVAFSMLFCCTPKCRCEGIADKFFSTMENLNLWKSDEKSSESSSADENPSKDEFTFIKSGENESNFIYNDNWLLYGGIFLILASITGMIFTFKNPKKSRKKRKK